MQGLSDHPLTQFIILGFGFLAFLILVKTGASYLPDSSIPGAIKKVVMMA